MNYRQISTKTWKDDKFVSLDDSCQKLVLYLITNSQIGLIPVYKIQEREALFDLCWNKEKYQKCLEKIKIVGIYLIDGYIILYNQFANYFITGGKTEEERERQINSLPENIKSWVNNEISIAQLLSNQSSMIETITPISISNIKPINIYSDIEKIDDELMQKIADHYHIKLSDVKNTYDSMYLWCKSKGKTYKDYKAGLMNWVQKKIEDKKILINK